MSGENSQNTQKSWSNEITKGLGWLSSKIFPCCSSQEEKHVSFSEEITFIEPQFPMADRLTEKRLNAKVAKGR